MNWLSFLDDNNEWRRVFKVFGKEKDDLMKGGPIAGPAQGSCSNQPERTRLEG